MNIGFVAPQISMSMGGIQNTSYLFIEPFSKLCNFYAFCAKDSDNVEGYEKNVIYSTYNQNETFAVHKDLIKRLFSAHKKDKFDFTFAALYPYALSCYLLKKFKGVPYGVMIHGNELMSEPARHGLKGKTIGILKRFFKVIILRNADIVFANSNYTKELFLKTCSNQTVVVIHPPIKYVDRNVDTYNLKRNFILLSIGRIINRKGFQFVIKAIVELVKKFPKLRYYIAGSGSYYNTLKNEIVELGLEKHVFLLGQISEEEKDRLYQECDYFIMPSFTIDEDGEVEGFGVVYIEANMYGKYVIGTKEGGVSDAIIEGETGSFVKSKDYDSIVKLLSHLYESEYSYSPQKCIEWAKAMDRSLIVDAYLKEIEKIVGITIKAEGQLKKIQSKELAILLEIDKICRKHDITYYLDAGTLLGAVRHKGFIPWDDDIDIVMPRAEYKRFAKVAQSELPEYLFYQDEWNDKGHYSPMARVRDERTCVIFEPHEDTGTEHRGLWVDIFPLDECASKKGFDVKFRFFIAQNLGRIIRYKMLPWKKCIGLKGKIIKAIASIFSFIDFKKIRLNCITQGNTKNYDYCLFFGTLYGYARGVVPKKAYGSPIELDFESLKFYGPSDPDTILTTIYGDYMKLPKEEDRVGHGMNIVSFG